MQEIDRRLALLLPAVASLAILPNEARSQNVGDLAEVFGGAEDVFRSVSIRRPDEFTLFFNVSWQLRTSLAFAVLSDDSADALQRILAEAENQLIEDHGGEISREINQQIIRNSMFFQNAVFSRGANQESGEVQVDRGALFFVRDVICPLYPFC